jgi:hypothetical protein
MVLTSLTFPRHTGIFMDGIDMNVRLFCIYSFSSYLLDSYLKALYAVGDLPLGQSLLCTDAVRGL